MAEDKFNKMKTVGIDLPEIVRNVIYYILLIVLDREEEKGRKPMLFVPTMCKNFIITTTTQTPMSGTDFIHCIYFSWDEISLHTENQLPMKLFQPAGDSGWQG